MAKRESYEEMFDKLQAIVNNLETDELNLEICIEIIWGRR